MLLFAIPYYGAPSIPRPPTTPHTHTHTVHGAIRPPCSVMVGSGRPATSCEMISLMLCRAVLVDLLPTAALLTYFRPIPRKPKTPPHLPTTAAGYVPAFGAAGASAQWRPAGGAGEAGEGLLAGLADPGGGGGGALAPAGLPAVGGMGGGGGGAAGAALGAAFDPFQSSGGVIMGGHAWEQPDPAAAATATVLYPVL